MFFTRRCLQVAVVVWLGVVAAVFAALLAVAPQVALLAAGLALFYGAGRKYVGSGWVFGTARLANVRDMARAGYLGADSGLLVCQVKVRFGLAANFLFKLKNHLAACALFYSWLQRKPVPVRLNQGVHTMIVAPAGAGKGVSLVVPFLLTDEHSAVVLDPKGELALLTAKARRAMGHHVVILDPFKVVTDKPDTFNPLSVISADDPSGLDDVKALAESIVVRTGEEREPHWNDGAEMFITAVLGFIAQAATPEHRNVNTAAMVLADPAELAGATKAMTASPAWSGMLARMGNNLTHFVEKERSSTLTTTNRHTRFTNTPLVADSLKDTSFDPRLLKAGKMTVYLVLPTEYLRSHSALLRLWITALQRVVVKSGLGEKSRVIFLLDEAAALGNMQMVLDALTQMRGYGLRSILVYQSLGQLKTCFPDGQDQTVLSNCDTQVFFGVNDLPTAEYVSKRIGMATVQNWSENGGTSTSTSTDSHGGTSTSRSSNAGHSVQEVAREVLKPEEIMQLPQREAIVFAPRVPPLHCWLTRYYEGLPLRLTGFGKFVMGLRALCLAAIGLGAAACMLFAVDDATRKQPPSALPPPARIQLAGEVKP